MSGIDKHDNHLIDILNEEGQIIPFLDAVFGFLQRRTDFYVVQKHRDAKIGFPPGVAENIVRATFKKWQKLATAVTHEDNMTLVEGDMTDLVIREEEVVTSESPPAVETAAEQPAVPPVAERPDKKDDLSTDTFNGADCEAYRWSQTLLEVDIKVLVPSSVMKANQVRVDIQANRLSVKVQDSTGQQSVLVDGDLGFKHNKEESIWTLTPGRHVTIHLEKVKEEWWDCLLATETRLNLAKLDLRKDPTDLTEEDHMQVDRIMRDEERKLRGLPSTLHQEQLDLLKKAWNIEGSPFQGTAFDPSVLQPPQ